MRRINRWRYAALMILLLGVTTVMSPSVNAYLADGDTVTNPFEVGGNRIEIIEEFTPPDELQPGSVITKTVRVKNIGHSPCYVRIKAVFSDSEVGQYCSLDWNLEDYEYDAEDGYYYYTRAIEPGETTGYLFSTVSVSEDAPQSALTEVSVLVYAESCGSGSAESYTAAWADYGRNKP